MVCGRVPFIALYPPTDWNQPRNSSAAYSFGSERVHLARSAPEGNENSWSTCAPRNPGGSSTASSRETIAPPSLPWVP